MKQSREQGVYSIGALYIIGQRAESENSVSPRESLAWFMRKWGLRTRKSPKVGKMPPPPKEMALSQWNGLRLFTFLAVFVIALLSNWHRKRSTPNTRVRSTGSPRPCADDDDDQSPWAAKGMDSVPRSESHIESSSGSGTFVYAWVGDNWPVVMYNIACTRSPRYLSGLGSLIFEFFLSNHFLPLSRVVKP